jgi:RNA polymerase sigma factor (sigma-70 family)
MINPDNHKNSPPVKYDVQLWDALQKGDHIAYGKIYTAHVDTLYAYGKKLRSHTTLVEDAIQDVFIDLWRYKATLGPVRSIKAYLFACLRRQLTRSIKKEKVVVLDDQYLQEDNFETSTLELLIHVQDRQEEVAKINKALNQLSKRQKEIIYLRYFQDLSYQEIGQMMGLNQRSTYNLVSKALSMLKEKMVMVILMILSV